MTVKDLKEKLEALDENMTVVVQFRDGGGDYSGQDDIVYFEVDKENNRVIL